jgi:hypothetical protein
VPARALRLPLLRASALALVAGSPRGCGAGPPRGYGAGILRPRAGLPQRVASVPALHGAAALDPPLARMGCEEEGAA